MTTERVRRPVHATGLLVVLALASLIAAVPSPAQVQPDHDCRVALNKFNADPRSEAFRWALTYGRLHTCGAEAAQALATRLGRFNEVTDTALLRSFTLQASGIQHPALAEAALRSAINPALGERQRVASVQIALAQHDVEFRLPHFERLDPARPCEFRIIWEYEYGSTTPLASDYRDLLVSTMDRLFTTPTEPPRVRAAAACVLAVTRDFHPLEPLDDPDVTN